jgi:predicted PurR-regulated permease PerM
MQRGTLLTWWDATTPPLKIILITLAVPLLVLNGWAVFAIADYFHSLLVILLGASLLAFLLNYPVRFLERQGNNRERAAIVVFLLALALLIAAGVTLLPSVLRQAQQLVARLPEWAESGRQQLFLLSDRFETTGLPLSFDTLAAQVIDPLKNQIQGLTGKVLNVAVFTVTSLLDFLLTLVLTFYLLQHGTELWDSLIDWLPPRVRQPFSQTLRQSFQNFFLSQFILASSMGVILTLVFLWWAVPFGLLFGLTIGTMALVPFGGSVGITVVTLLVALRDIGLGLKVLGICLLVQQIIENLVAPRFLGSITGLNPVWIFISILTGARIGGLLGVVVAVPVAVVVKNALGFLRGDPDALEVGTAGSLNGLPNELTAPVPHLEPESTPDEPSLVAAAAERSPLVKDASGT